MMGQYIIADDGEVVEAKTMEEWSRFFGDTERRKLAHDTITDGVEVSTVFLGIDHNFGSNGPPVLWETMIFGGPQDGYQERYSSREAALEGHRIAVEIATHA
jgi:hypothetical protein